ncbi:MaoC family dehydratase [Streptomyces sp. NPDC058953]|uniref:MaoC family dehydratase n=1 Tax=Streptomyces sp. NPDC058953 TaxID=3346676 RepID=UPI003675A8AF
MGDELPPLEIPITRTLIVAGAMASRDFQDVHHDAEAARSKGSPDVFMNILTTNGLVGRYVTDCLGTRAALRRVAIRLGVPNYPGDTMVLRGTVASVDECPAAAPDFAAPDTGGTEATRIAEVRIVGTNSLGRHVTGTVTVLLPAALPAAHPAATEPVAVGENPGGAGSAGNGGGDR